MYYSLTINNIEARKEKAEVGFVYCLIFIETTGLNDNTGNIKAYRYIGRYPVTQGLEW